MSQQQYKKTNYTTKTVQISKNSTYIRVKVKKKQNIHRKILHIPPFPLIKKATKLNIAQMSFIRYCTFLQ